MCHISKILEKWSNYMFTVAGYEIESDLRGVMSCEYKTFIFCSNFIFSDF